MIRLYIIDDHFIVFDGFCFSFGIESNEFEIVGGSLTVDDAYKFS